MQPKLAVYDFFTESKVESNKKTLFGIISTVKSTQILFV